MQRFAGVVVLALLPALATAQKAPPAVGRDALGAVQLTIDARRAVAATHLEDQYVDAFLDAGFARRFLELGGVLAQIPLGSAPDPWALQVWALGGIASTANEDPQHIEVGELPRAPVAAGGLGLRSPSRLLLWLGAAGMSRDEQTDVVPVISGADDLTGLFAQLGLDLQAAERTSALLGWQHDFEVLDRGVTVLTRPRLAYERFEVSDERRVDRVLVQDPLFLQLVPGPGLMFVVPLLVAVPFQEHGVGGKTGIFVAIPLTDENRDGPSDIGQYQDSFMRLGGYVSAGRYPDGGAVGGGGELAWGNVDHPAFLLSVGYVEPEFASRYPEFARSMVLRVNATLTF